MPADSLVALPFGSGLPFQSSPGLISQINWLRKAHLGRWAVEASRLQCLPVTRLAAVRGRCVNRVIDYKCELSLAQQDAPSLTADTPTTPLDTSISHPLGHFPYVAANRGRMSPSQPHRNDRSPLHNGICLHSHPPHSLDPRMT